MAQASKGKNIGLWVLQVIVAAAFLAAGGAKLAGVPEMVATFEKIGVGQWFRYVTGGLEVVGAIGLLVPRYTLYAAGMLTTIMIGAVISHFALLGGNPAPAIGLLVLSAVIAYGRKGN